MKTKICGKCKKEKPITEFLRHNRDEYRSRCKPCHREDNKEYLTKYMKEYQKRPEVREYKRLKAIEYRKNPEVKFKVAARNIVTFLKLSGKLKQEPCISCGATQVESHHTDYGKPLLIVWLCPDCHDKEHQKD